MDARKQERCAVSEHWYHNPEKERFYFMFESESVPARIVDIHLGGIGFEVYEPHDLKVGQIDNSGDTIIKLYLGETFIMAGIRIAWYTEGRGARQKCCRGGLRIDLISPEDRLLLYDFIERARKSRAAGQLHGDL